MQPDDPTKSVASAVHPDKYRELTDLFRAAAVATRRRGPKGQILGGSTAILETSAAVARLHESPAIRGFLRETAAKYEDLARDLREKQGTNVTVSELLPRLVVTSLSQMGSSAPSPAFQALANAMAQESVSSNPCVLPLVARREGSRIRLYAPYAEGLAKSLSTSISEITGEWVPVPADGKKGAPDLVLLVQYAYSAPAPRVIVELTWVGTETVSMFGRQWERTPLDPQDESAGFHAHCQPITPIDGLTKVSLELAVAGTPTQYDIWIVTSASAAGDVGKDRPLVDIVPIPAPVPSPTPVDIPNETNSEAHHDPSLDILARFLIERGTAFAKLLALDATALGSVRVQSVANLGIAARGR